MLFHSIIHYSIYCECAGGMKGCSAPWRRGLVTVQSWGVAVVARNGNKNKLSLFHKINVPKNNLLRATWMIKMDDKSLLQK